MSHDSAPPRDRLRLLLLVAACAGVVAAAATVQALAGAYEMSWRAGLAALADREVWGHPEVLLRFLLGEEAAAGLGLRAPAELATATLVVWSVRIPRLLVGALVGVNLSVAGAIFQATTRNAMASPFTLGVSAGSGLAVMIVLVLFPAWSGSLPLLASLGGGATFLIVYAIAWRGGTSPLRLVLAGIVVGAVAGSLQTGLYLMARDLNVVRDAVSWMAGTLAGAGWRQFRMAAPFTLIVVSLALASSRYLDVMLLGDASARALGLPVERTRFLLSATAVLAAGTAVAVAGHVGFIGLIVPHVVRNTVGSSHRHLLVGCMAAGPALVLGADTIARLLLNPVQLPVGVITGLVGGVYFLLLMRRQEELKAL